MSSISILSHAERPFGRFSTTSLWRVFLPVHLLNSGLRTGGGQGGMDPGASSGPFEAPESEYLELVPQVLNPDRVALEQNPRFVDQQWTLDATFDHATEYHAWFAAVCDKHCKSFQERLRNR